MIALQSSNVVIGEWFMNYIEDVFIVLPFPKYFGVLK